ncbi:MAG: phosphoadenylyl-sulfate reductase [Acidobacteria bacterium]|nr:phosphoadenylyl-sulfate reductase [Acidobacteriota bacterium]
MSNVAVLQGWADRTAPLETCADALEGAPPEEILRWAIDRYADRLTFATGFGAEGCVLIDLIGRHRLPIDLFTLDTGVLFPETRDLWRRLEARYGLTIRGVRPQPGPGADSGASLDPAERLWERDPDGCCARRKVFPLAAELRRVDAWITAIRRDQTPQRADAPVVGWDAKFGIAKVNPLVTWTSRDVWRYLRARDVPYNPLHDRGYPSVGCWPCTSPVRPGEDARAGRWRGTAKTECGLHGSAVPLEEAPAT